MKALRRSLAVSLFAITAACSSEPSPLMDAETVDAQTEDAGFVSTPLVLPSAWEMIAPEDDPLDHRTPESDCPLDGVIPESEGIEIKTAICNYAELTQPSLADVKSTDRIHFVFWHFDLVAAEPAEAHVALLLNDQILHEEFIPIPGDAKSYDLVLDVPNDVPKGSPVVIHLHNHGSNAWTFAKIDRIRP